MTFPNTSVLDNFNRANQAPPGAGWTGSTLQPKELAVVSNRLADDAPFQYGTDGWNTLHGPDLEWYFDIAAGNVLASNIIFVMWRCDTLNVDPYSMGDTSNRYMASIDLGTSNPNDTYNGFITIFYHQTGDGSTEHLIAGMAGIADIGPGDSIGCSHVGNTIKIYLKNGAGPWTEVISAVDSHVATAGYTVLDFQGSSIAIDNFGGGTYTPPTPPAAPSLLVATPVSDIEIDLTWQDNSTNEANFELESSSDGATWSLLTSPAANATSYNDASLSAFTTRYYRIRAVNAGGNSAWSNTANATTFGPPGAPFNFTATPISTSEVHLTWLPNGSDISFFRLEKAAALNGTYLPVSTPGAGDTSYNDTFLSANFSYFYRIREENPWGVSAWATVQVTTYDLPRLVNVDDLYVHEITGASYGIRVSNWAYASDIGRIDEIVGKDIFFDASAKLKVKNVAYRPAAVGFAGSHTLEPTRSDLAVFDALGYQTWHANDIDAALTAIHHTLGTDPFQAAPGDHAHASANPTASVGLTVVNGVAGTFMRSDAAPPLSQAITPTWTGLHTFNPGTTSSEVIRLDMAHTGTSIDSHWIRFVAQNTGGASDFRNEWKLYVQHHGGGTGNSYFTFAAQQDNGGFSTRLKLSMFDADNSVFTGPITAANLSGTNTGDQTTIGAVTITNDVTTNASMYPVWVAGNSGAQAPYVSSTKLFFNPSTGLLSLPSMAITGTAGAGYITLIAQSANPSAPAAGTLLLHSSTTQGFTRMEQDNEAATNLVLGRDNVFIAKNTTVSTIAKGSAVYVTGSTGNVPNIGLAKADSTTTLPAVGIALDAIASNAFGQVMMLGILASYDTSAFSTGDILYVSATVAGAFTKTRPVSPLYAQRVGSVLVSGVGNGSIYVDIAPFVGGLESGTTASAWVAAGTISASNLSGTNTGDQTITLSGAVSGTGTGAITTTLATPGTLTVSTTNNASGAHTHAITSSSAPGAAASLLATDASGIIGSTGTRIVKIWATDLTVTNAIAGSVTGNAGTVTNATFTTALTVNGGTLTLTANVANSSVLTIGAGAVSVSGSNTGDQTIPAAANPTASSTGAAINGSAATFMRSDAAPLINLDPAHGGTGVNNSTRTITISTNNAAFDFSGAYTLTVPATGTAALLATANTFTALQTITGAATGNALTVTNTVTTAVAVGASYFLARTYASSNVTGASYYSAVDAFSASISVLLHTAMQTQLLFANATSNTIATTTSQNFYINSPSGSTTANVTINTLYGLRMDSQVVTGITPSTTYYIYLAGDTVSIGTSKYGLYIGSISGAGTNNYAIYTNTGAVRFGGSLTVVGAFGCNGATAQTAYASGGAAPAGGTGATAGAYDTAAHRDALITLVNNIRTALVNNGIMS